MGASVRWAVGTIAPDGSFPWMTLLVNLVGCGVLGWVLRARPRPELAALVGTGFCGGLTTFATMSVEIATLLRTEKAVVSWAYLIASAALGLAAFGVGRLAASTTIGDPR